MERQPLDNNRDGKPIAITCVIGPFFPVPPIQGGAVERINLTLCEEFARQGHSVKIISRMFPGLPRTQVLNGVIHRRVKSSSAPKNRLLYRILDLIYAFRVIAALEKSDVTITNSVSLPLVLPKAKAGLIYVSVARNPKGQMGLYRRAARLQAVSRHIENEICEQSPNVRHLVKTVPNCLSREFSSAIGTTFGTRRKEILYVGRIAREKGIHLLLRAFNLLSRKYPDWKLTIIGPHQPHLGGDGDAFLRELRGLVERNPESVRFLGPIFDEKELIQKMGQAQIFVYPSIAAAGESFGLAPLEAMACGCPVVLSQLECFSDYLKPGFNGLTFDQADETGETLAVALSRLIESEELRNKLAVNAIATSREFTPQAVAKLFLDDFRSLLKQHVQSA